MVAREEQLKEFKIAIESDESEMIVVTGRRRVGKTFLVRNAYKEGIDFEMVGIQNGTKEEQLQNFCFALRQSFDLDATRIKPYNWIEAFQILIELLETYVTDKKRIVFIDELPWVATKRSGFLKGLEFFWNSWASKSHVVLIICGSATSWINKKIILNKGGLHNRVTRTISLAPFTLAEVKEYLLSKKIELNKFQICLLYMSLGGIPYYLKMLRSGESAAQTINRLCFEKGAPLRREFNNLYPALFDNAERHIAIIKALALKNSGMTIEEIINQTGISSGGTLTNTLEELELSGFISSHTPLIKKKKDTIFRLADEYSLFYLKFMESASSRKQQSWIEISQSQQYKIWCGYAFENLCLRHVNQIKKSLNISGIQSEAYSYLQKGDQEHKGVQIDMLIDRKDNVINLCELKFNRDTYRLTNLESQKIRARKNTLITATRERKQVFVTMITTYGIHQNEHSLGVVDNELTIEDLFS